MKRPKIFLTIISKIKQKKDWLSVLFSTMGIKLIDLFRGLFVAQYLGPETFGILSAIQLISQLNKYGSLGFNAIAGREVPFLEGKGELEKADEVKQNAYSSELIFSTILLTIGIISVLFIQSKSLKYAILLASIGLFLGKIGKLHRTELVLEKKFIPLSLVDIWISAIISILIIFSVPYYGMHGILFLTALGSLIAILVFQRYIQYQYKFSIKINELIRQIGIGVPLVFGTLSYGFYRYSEKFIIMFFIGMKELGYYAIATKIMQSTLHIALTRIKVVKIQISTHLGRGNYGLAHNIIKKESMIFSLALLVIAPVIALGVNYLVPIYLSKYASAITAMQLITIAPAIRIIGSFFSIAIISPLVNKQKLIAPVQISATVLIYVLSFILYYHDNLSLTNFIIIDIIGYLFYHIGIVIIYYYYFVRKYVQTIC